MLGFSGSKGMAFLLRTIPAASARASASTPVTPTPWRSWSERWVSVPPVVGRMPYSPSDGRQLLRVGDDPARVVGVLGGRALLEVDRLRRDGVHLRAALHHREDRPVERRRVLLLADQGARARAAQHLVRREGDDVRIRHRAGDGLPGHQPDEVRGVDPEDRADLVGEVAEELEVDEPGDRTAAGEDDLGPVLARQRGDLVVVDVLGLLVHAVVDGVEPLAGEGHLRAVRQVAAVRQRHGEQGLARLHEGAVDGLVRAGAAVRLHVGVVGLEQRLAPLDGDGLGLVDLGAAAVVATPRVALGVLVRQRRPQRGEHLGRRHVLAGDELEPAADPAELGQQDPGDVGVEGLEGAEVGAVEGVVGLVVRQGGLRVGREVRPQL